MGACWKPIVPPLMVLVVASVLRAEDADGVESIPDAARSDLEAGIESYRRGDCREALAGFQRAEAAGARGGLLFYRMGYCHDSLGNPEANREYKRRAVPFLERQIEDGVGGMDPYYYLVASYYNDLDDRARGDAIALRAIEILDAAPPAADLGGEQLFRVARLCGFAVDALEAGEAGAAGGTRLQMLERRRIFTYREAAKRMLQERRPNRTYLIIALTEVADATRRAGNVDEAIRLYGRASGVDPARPAAGQVLMQMAFQAVRAGDYDRARRAWASVRGPGHLKTPAQYGMNLAKKAGDHGELPSSFEGAPIAGLDRSALERGMLEAAQVLIAHRTAQDSDGPSPEEARAAEGRFLALALAYLGGGHDLRQLIVANQLVPLVFR